MMWRSAQMCRLVEYTYYCKNCPLWPRYLTARAPPSYLTCIWFPLDLPPSYLVLSSACLRSLSLSLSLVVRLSLVAPLPGIPLLPALPAIPGYPWGLVKKTTPPLRAGVARDCEDRAAPLLQGAYVYT